MPTTRFGTLTPKAEEDAVHEVVANAVVAFARLVELGKSHLAYPTVLARYGVARLWEGRHVGNRSRKLVWAAGAVLAVLLVVGVIIHGQGLGDAAIPSRLQLEPGREVDAEGDLVGHRGPGVLDTRGRTSWKRFRQSQPSAQYPATC